MELDFDTDPEVQLHPFVFLLLIDCLINWEDFSILW